MSSRTFAGGFSPREFQQVTPHVVDKKGPKDVDESSDTYDTIEWLLKNVSRHNGRVGMFGVSYPGFYCSAGMIDAHPASRRCRRRLRWGLVL